MSTTVKLKHDSITSFSHDGQQYEPVKGVFELPHEVAAVAVEAWGFVAVPGKGGKDASGSKAESSTGSAVGVAGEVQTAE